MAFHRDFTDFTNEIDAPAGEIFAFFKRIEEWPSWTRAIRKTKRTDTGDWRVGYRFVMHASFAPAIPLRITMHEYEEHRLIGWGVKWPLGLLTVIHRFHFEPLGPGRCRIRNHEFAEGLLAPLMAPLKGMIDRFDRQWADDLEAKFRKRNAA